MPAEDNVIEYAGKTYILMDRPDDLSPVRGIYETQPKKKVLEWMEYYRCKNAQARRNLEETNHELARLSAKHNLASLSAKNKKKLTANDKTLVSRFVSESTFEHLPLGLTKTDFLCHTGLPTAIYKYIKIEEEHRMAYDDSLYQTWSDKTNIRRGKLLDKLREGYKGKF